MSLATGAQLQILQLAETTFGTLATPANMKIVRKSGESLELLRGRLVSPEILSNRQKSDVRLTQKSMGGDLDFPLIYGDFDDFLEATMGGTWTADISETAADITFASTGGNNGTITSAALVSFTTDGWIVGDAVVVTGSAGNSKQWNVTNVALHVLTVSGTVPMVAEASGPSITLKTARQTVKNGSTKRSFSIEVGQLDISQFELYVGSIPTKLQLDWKFKNMVMGKMSFIGKDMTLNPATSALTVVPASTNDPMDTFSGSLNEAGTPIAIVTGLSLTINGNQTPDDVIMQATMQDYFLGDFDITGQLDVLFKDNVLYNKFINETESELDITSHGIKNTARTLTLKVPRLKYSTFKKSVTTPKGIPVSMAFDALFDPTTGTTAMFTRSGV